MYRVPSDRGPTFGPYNVQVNIEHGVGICTCQGYERARRYGHPCKHIERALATERQRQHDNRIRPGHRQG